MGLCASSSAEAKRSRHIAAAAERDAERDRMRVKLLLLGAGEGGKSTLFKQMRLLYGRGFSEEDRRAFTPVVRANTVSAIRTLVSQADAHGFAIAATAARRALDALPADAEDAGLDAATGRAIVALWEDAGVRAAYAARARFLLPDSAAYYLAKADVLGDPGYVPSVEDVLKARLRTTSILEETFSVEGVDFVLMDVGGQRNERKKWIHCFDGVTGVIFVAALSEYDQTLEEDARVNRTAEAMSLFAEVANSRWFAHSAVILFLNKRDIFEEKIRSVDLRHTGGDGVAPRFLDYTGGKDAEAAKQYMLARFLALAKRERPVYTHITCATDTENVRVVFAACKATILQDNLRGSGFIE